MSVVIPESAPVVWVHVFQLACYGLTMGCLYHAVRVGIHEYREAAHLGHPWRAQVCAGGTQVGFLALFVLLFWALESWAHFRTPYYVYDRAFSDLMVRVPFDEWLPGLAPELFGSAKVIEALQDADSRFARIPLSIPLLEASLTYASMWIAFLLGVGFRFAPFLAALIMVNADLILDPVVAVGHPCRGTVCENSTSGIGLWHWYYADPSAPAVEPVHVAAATSGADLPPVSAPTDTPTPTPAPTPTPTPPETAERNRPVAVWFGIPLFNYGAWWSAPVVCVSLVLVVQYFRGRFWPRRRGRAERHHMPTVAEAGVLALVGGAAAAIVLLVWISPNDAMPLGPRGQWVLMGTVLVGTLVWLARLVARGGLSTHDQAEPTLTRVAYLMVAFPVAALGLDGAYVESPALMVVALTTALLGGFLVWLPFPKRVQAFFQELLDVDRFVRVHYFGFALMLGLLGAFAVGVVGAPVDGAARLALVLDGGTVSGVIAIALLYHVWAFVMNDVIDLDTDRLQPKRRFDPMVRGRMSRETGFAIAALSLPPAFGIAFLMSVGRDAYLVLALGAVLMLAYNVWGKRCPFPPITDFVQGAAWGCLAVFAALAVAPAAVAGLVAAGVGPAAAESLVAGRASLVAAVAAWGTGYILLINGIHGGLRDLVSDRRAGARTTAIVFGAGVDAPTGAAISNGRIAAFAYAVQVAMLALGAWMVHAGPTVPGAPGWTAALWPIAFYASAFVSLATLWFVVKPRSDDRDAWVTRHIFLALLPAIPAFGPYLDGTAASIVLAGFFVPLLVQQGVVRRVLRVLQPSIADAAIRPPT